MNNTELLFINVLLNKDNYNIYKDEINIKSLKETHRELSYIYTVLFSLHEEHKHDLTLSDVQLAFYVKYPDADKVVYDAIFNTLTNSPITPDVGLGIVTQLRNRKVAMELSEISFKVAQGTESLETLNDFYAKNVNKDDHQNNQELPLSSVSLDLNEIIESSYAEQGLRWRLQCLNKSLGSLRPGDFGFIFARPETGKTTFLASECTNFLEGSTRPVVWLNNEEQGAKVMLRIYQAYFGVTTAQLMANQKKYREAFLAQTAGRFFLFDSAIIERGQVERIVKKLNPQVVIYDQIDKIRGFSSDREDLRLGAIYQWARELAKGSHAAIGVCQADGTAENVRYLTMEHVANAKTAKQAEADWILGIGKSHEMEKARFFNISKNKLLGDKDSIPDLRHGRFEVLLEPSIARYQDVIRYD